MNRMEELEAGENAGQSLEEEEMKEETPAQRVETLKAQGNQAFAHRKFEKALDCYTQALALDSSSHVGILFLVLVFAETNSVLTSEC